MEESVIISTYRAMLTNLRNGWTSLEDIEKLKNKCLDKEQYEQCESIKMAIDTYLREKNFKN